MSRSQNFKIALTYGAGITTCFAVFSGIQHVITWIVCIVSGVVAIGGFFYSFTPIFFMDILYILIKFLINYISASGVIRLLSGLLFGRILTGVIETHEDLPEIGAASCKLILITTQEKTSALIFQQFENANALVKLISVVEKRLESLPPSPILKKKYATVLAPMVKVLKMLVKSYHKQEKRSSLLSIAFQLMNQYRDCATSVEDVADVVGSAAWILEHLIVNYGGLSFNEETACYTTTSCTDKSNLKLESILLEVIGDKELCISLTTIIAQKEGSLLTAGSVFRLLLCLLQADVMCKGSSTSVLGILYPSSSETLVLTLIHLLERESSALAAHEAEMAAIMSEREGDIDMLSLEKSNINNADIALLRMCTHMGVLATLPEISTNSVKGAADAGLSCFLTSFGDWVKKLLTSTESLVEVKRLLRLLLTTTGKVVDGQSHLKEASNSYRALSVIVGQGVPEQIAAVEAEARLLRQENEILQAEIVKLTSPGKESLKASRDDGDSGGNEYFATKSLRDIRTLSQDMQQLKALTSSNDVDSEGSEKSDFYDKLNKDENGALAEKIHQLEEQLSEKGATIDQLTLSLADTERRWSALRSESEKKDKDLIAAKDELDNSNARILTLTSDLQRSQESNTNLSQELKASEVSLKDARAELACVKEQGRKAIAEKTAIAKELHAAQDDLKKAHASYEEQLKNAQIVHRQASAALNTTNADLTQKLRKSEDALQSAKDDIASYIEALKGSKGTIDDLSQKLQQSEEDLQNLLNSITEPNFSKAPAVMTPKTIDPIHVLAALTEKDRLIRAERVNAQTPQTKLSSTLTALSITKLTGHRGAVLAVTFSPDGACLASGSLDRTIRLWSMVDGSSLNTLNGHENSVLSLSFSPGGSILASGSQDESVGLWSTVDGTLVRFLHGHTNTVNSVSFSHDGSCLASGSTDNTIRVWSILDGYQLLILNGHTSIVSSVSFSRDDSTLASGSWDQTIRLWSMSDGSNVRTLTGHNNLVNSVVFSTDSSRLASGSADKTVRVWSMSDQSSPITMLGHNNLVNVNAVTFSPDGSCVASGSTDRTIQLWSVTDGKFILSLTGHSSAVTSLSFSGDGSCLASGSQDNTIRFWFF